jgi:hypothetical protein
VVVLAVHLALLAPPLAPLASPPNIPLASCSFFVQPSKTPSSPSSQLFSSSGASLSQLRAEAAKSSGQQHNFIDLDSTVPPPATATVPSSVMNLQNVSLLNPIKPIGRSRSAERQLLFEIHFPEQIVSLPQRLRDRFLAWKCITSNPVILSYIKPGVSFPTDHIPRNFIRNKIERMPDTHVKFVSGEISRLL